MRNSQDYREHAEAAEDIAASTGDHLLKTNFLQLARTWREAAEKAPEPSRETLAS